jgi:GT2 family glycosyltransferase
MSQPKLAVVVPFYDGGEYLDGLLASLEGAPTAPLVYLVDNGTQPLSAVPTGCRLVRSRPGIGFGRAVNVGVRVAHFDGCAACLVVNQDVRFEAGAVAALVEAGGPGTITVPLQVGWDSGVVSDFFVRWYLALVPELVEAALSGDVAAAYPIPRLPGACFLAATADLIELGPFDPLYFMYGEDVDLGQRFVDGGGRVLLVPGARIAHHHTNARADDRGRHRLYSWQTQGELIAALSRGTTLRGAVRAAAVARGPAYARAALGMGPRLLQLVEDDRALMGRAWRLGGFDPRRVSSRAEAQAHRDFDGLRRMR